MGLRKINENEGLAAETKKVVIATSTSVFKQSKKSKDQK